MPRKNRTKPSSQKPTNSGVSANDIPRPPCVRPLDILAGSEEERFARHRARFAGSDFDLDELNRIQRKKYDDELRQASLRDLRSESPGTATPSVMKRPEFMRAPEIYSGSEEERFARHINRFLGGTDHDFDLKGVNFGRGWAAHKRYCRDMELYHEWLKKTGTESTQPVSEDEAENAGKHVKPPLRIVQEAQEPFTLSTFAAPELPGDQSLGSITRKLHLVYRETENGESLIFASLARATEIDRLRRAIETSETWGEFRRRIGPEAHEQLFGEDFNDSDDDTEDSGDNSSQPSSDSPFDSGEVPGYCDGDYPPWLAQEMDKHMPPAIMERYSTHHESVFNGDFYKIDPEHREAILHDLREVGFTVEERPDLDFW